MAISETGTSIGNTSDTLGGEYQVFLSFRGPDTRCGFADVLYHALIDAGIRAFMDNEELRPGDIIEGKLLQSINDSKLYIPIFSPRYASSHWCLRELAKMMENTFKSGNEDKKVVLPIFYDVIPDDVKLKTKLYENAILKLERQMEDQKKRSLSGRRKKKKKLKFRTEDVQTWRRALCEVDGTKGWERKNHSGDGVLCKKVVDEVVDRLKTRQRKEEENLVGVEVRIAAINELLDINSTDVKLIEIYGMSGMGKTTLAQNIFNRLHSHFGKFCSFLENVRGNIEPKALIELQEQLLSDISYFRGASKIVNIGAGIKAIEDTLCNKKALIVLDDVDDSKQIQNLIGTKTLCPGTRIIVTTRNQSSLTDRGCNYHTEPYELKRLSDEEALELFSRHVFNEVSPPAAYHGLSIDIVATAGGLPLAVQAIGSLLRDHRHQDIWDERLKMLKKTPPDDVLGKLRISYDALNGFQQDIFLDIACFFTGWNKIGPIFMWDDFGPIDSISMLIKRCMIKVLDDNRFWMHDQYKDLARKIAKDGCTRLWERDDINHRLRLTQIKESVQALRLEADVSKPITVTAQQIEQFPYLRFLCLRNVICQGDFTGILSKLKWIELHYSREFYSCLEPTHSQGFRATNLPGENFVVLKLSGHEFTEERVSSLIAGAWELKILTLYRNPSEGTQEILTDC